MLKLLGILAIICIIGLTACTQTQGDPYNPVSEPISPHPDNFTDFVTDFVFLQEGLIVMNVRGGIAWAREFQTGNLLKSYNHGDDWLHVYEFADPVNAVYLDDFGNIFVSTSHDRWAEIGTGKLFVSNDGGVSFRHVLDVQAGAAVWWNIASQEGTMFLSEYGYKWHGNNARRVYRSTDYGENWEIVLYPPEVYNRHNHCKN